MDKGKRNGKTTYRSAALLLAGFVLAGLVSGRAPSFADSVEELEQQKEQTKREAEALEKARRELMDSLEGMDSELFALSDEVNTLSEEIDRTEEEIIAAEEELALAGERAKKQYDNMKLRIQYMYENGGVMSWTSIFSAESFTDALKRVEYALDLATTDRGLLEEYKNTLQQIAEDKLRLEEKYGELLAAQVALGEKKARLLSSIEVTRADISGTDEQLAEREWEIAAYEDEIAAMKEYERKLEEEQARKAAEEQARKKAEEEARKKAEEEERKKAEEEARKKAEEEERKKAEEAADKTAGEGVEQGTESGDGADAPKDGDGQDAPSDGGQDAGGTDNAPDGSEEPADYWLHTTTPVEVTEEEEELFAALIYCEAGGESYETQFAVASVVVNRINSSRFPNNLVDVIYQKKQFSPAASGRLAVVLEKGLTTESCRKAAKEALSGNICGDWLFFCYNFGKIDGTVIGSEVFY